MTTTITRATVAVLGLALVLASCGNGEAARVVAVGADDFSFSLPPQIEGGLVELQLINNGDQPHHGQLLRINEGHTLDEALAALGKDDQEAALRAVTPMGGPGVIGAGGRTSVTSVLAPGAYAFICFLTDPETRKPHVALGMVQGFTVTPTQEDVQTPATDAAVDLTDFAVGLPDGFEGRGTVAVRNAGEQPHEMLIARLAEGATPADLLQAFEGDGPPPATFTGGVQAMLPGQTAYLDLALSPGRYLFVCFVPDPASGKPHAALGMQTILEVN